MVSLNPIKEYRVPTLTGHGESLVGVFFKEWLGSIDSLDADRTVHAVNTIQGVIKFVGTGRAPQPLQEQEINKILGVGVQREESELHEEIPFHIDQVIEVTQGPFSDFSGTVKEIYPEKGKVKVEVSLFGRPTSVELDYTQLKGF